MRHVEQLLNTNTSHSKPPPKRKLYTKEHTQSTITEGDMSIRHTHTNTQKTNKPHIHSQPLTHTHTHLLFLGLCLTFRHTLENTHKHENPHLLVLWHLISQHWFSHDTPINLEI